MSEVIKSEYTARYIGAVDYSETKIFLGRKEMVGTLISNIITLCDNEVIIGLDLTKCYRELMGSITEVMRDFPVVYEDVSVITLAKLSECHKALVETTQTLKGLNDTIDLDALFMECARDHFRRSEEIHSL